MLEQMQTIDWCLNNYIKTIIYLENKIELHDVDNNQQLETYKEILIKLTDGSLILNNDIAKKFLKNSKESDKDEIRK